jgi:L-iditol 2-dehydrogenase
MNVLLARASGAVNLVLADCDERRLAMAAEVCADALIVNVARQDLTVEMMALTDRHGADVVLVTRAECNLVEAAFGLVARGGIIDFFSGLPKTDPVIPLDVNLMRANQFSIVGARGASPRHHALALQVLASGRIHAAPFVSTLYRLDQAAEAIDAIERGDVFKAVVKP